VDPSNNVLFIIQNVSLSKYFQIDAYGSFKIVTKKLDASMTSNGNGTFVVPILLSDLKGYMETVIVIVQLSCLVKENQCPRILDTAMCLFTINQTTFDPSKH
jgi:hypothetical protein